MYIFSVILCAAWCALWCRRLVTYQCAFRRHQWVQKHLLSDPIDYENMEEWRESLLRCEDGPKKYFREMIDRHVLPPGYGVFYSTTKDYTECASAVSALKRHIRLHYSARLMQVGTQAHFTSGGCFTLGQVPVTGLGECFALGEYKSYRRDIYFDTNVACYVIGDGVLPQCAALVSTLSPFWNIYSIDPALRVNRRFVLAKLPKNVTVCKLTAEEFGSNLQPLGPPPLGPPPPGLPLDIPLVPSGHIHLKASLSIVLAVHSHADLNAFWQRLPPDRPKLAIALPCCKRQFVNNLSPVETYRDQGILSLCNGVAVWSENMPCLPVARI